jgi:phage shock protein A
LAARYESQLIEQRRSVDTLKAALQDLNSKIEEVKREKNLLFAIEARAEAEHKILRLVWSASGVIDPIKQ